MEDFNFNERVNRILPYAKNWAELTNVPGKDYKENICTAVGWGSLEFGVPTDSLRYANMTVWHGTKACRCFDMLVHYFDIQGVEHNCVDIHLEYETQHSGTSNED